MSKIKAILLIILLLISFFIRLIDLSKNPPSLFSDEVDLGYQAFSFLKTGKDYFGNKLPISFHSFADYRAPIYIYSTVPFIAVFGLNEISVRFPAVIFSILGILFFFLTMNIVLNSFKFSFLSSVLLSISPWYYHYSRIGFEATCVFFLVIAGFYFFLKYIYHHKFTNLILSIILFTLTFYTYATARMFMPLLIIVLTCIYHKELSHLKTKEMLFCLILGIILLLPFSKDMLFGGSIHRFSYLNIFSDKNLSLEINRQRLLDSISSKDQVVGMKAVTSSFIFHNKPMSWYSQAVNNYFISLSTNFLFLSGDPNLRHNLPKQGQFYLIYLPLLIVGLFIGFKEILLNKNKDKVIKIMLVWILISPLPASITFDGGNHATRLFLMIIPMIYFISLGINKIFKTKIIFGGFVVLIVLAESVNYFHLYYIHYPVISGDYWHYGLKEIMLEINKLDNQYDKIFISSSFEKPLLFYLFWTKYDPGNFKLNNLINISDSEFEGVKMGKYYFGKIIAEKFFTKTKKEEKILIFSLRNEYGNDLNSYIFPNFTTIYTVNNTQRNPTFYLLSNK